MPRTNVDNFNRTVKSFSTICSLECMQSKSSVTIRSYAALHQLAKCHTMHLQP